MRFYEYVGPRECRLSERLGYHAPGTQIALELTVRSERGVQSEDSKSSVSHGEELCRDIAGIVSHKVQRRL